MQKHSCRTYFSINMDFDHVKNAVFLKERREEVSPEDLGIFNKTEVENFIVSEFGTTPRWNRHHFVLGYNDKYNVDVNKMLRITLKALWGKEEKLRELKEKFSLSIGLVIVPEIAHDSEEPNQHLSLENDIIEFLYKSGAVMDLDYYII